MQGESGFGRNLNGYPTLEIIRELKSIFDLLGTHYKSWRRVPLQNKLFGCKSQYKTLWEKQNLNGTTNTSIWYREYAYLPLYPMDPKALISILKWSTSCRHMMSGSCRIISSIILHLLVIQFMAKGLHFTNMSTCVPKAEICLWEVIN